MYFGYLISQNQPAAIAVTQPEYQASVRRILKDCDTRDILCVSITTDQEGRQGLHEGWVHLRWPQDQQQFILQLTSNIAA